MPGFNDLELQDLDLKPYMDPALLLDALSPDDMEMWQCGGYSFFPDDNLNTVSVSTSGSSSYKDSIKEENIEMDYCLSSICPNDLLSNLDQNLLSAASSSNNNTNTNGVAYINTTNLNSNNSNANFSNHSLSSSSSSSSSTTNSANYMQTNISNLMDRYEAFPSSFSNTSSSPNLDEMKSSSFPVQHHQQHHQQFDMATQLCHVMTADFPNHMELKLEDTFSSSSASLESSASASPIDLEQQQFFQLDHQTDSAHTSQASSPTSVTSSSASSLNEFNIYATNASQKPGIYHIQPDSQILVLTSQQQQQQQQQLQFPVVVNAPNATTTTTKVPKKAKKNSGDATSVKQSKQTIKKLTAMQHAHHDVDNTNANIKQQHQQLKKVSVLPPSPPSSFGSDSDSDQQQQIQQQQQQQTKQSHHVALHTKTGTKSAVSNAATLLKANRLNSSLRSTQSALLKQMRHQPYALKHAIKLSKCALENSTPPAPTPTATTVVMTTSSSSQSLIKEERDYSPEDDDCWPFLCSLSKLPSSGPLMLTEEEKRTLVQEGHQVPTQLPLTKGEEKILKKIRRKIKNKISAQESRRKKKEYVDSLEKRMETYINENSELKKRLEELELNNKSLLSQLQSMRVTLENSDTTAQQSLALQQPENVCGLAVQSSNTSQFGTLLMVLVLFFAVVLGVWSPVFTKDQMVRHFSTTNAATSASATAASAAAASTTTTSTAAAAASSATTATATNVITSGLVNQQQRVSNSIASGAAAVTAVCAAATSAAVASAAAFSVKTESVTPSHSPNNSGETLNSSSQEQNDMDTIASTVSFVESGQLNHVTTLFNTNNNANSVARSKTGTAVELTKVRPFIGKVAKTNRTDEEQPSNSSQIIILNIANTNSAPMNDVVSSATSSSFSSILGAKMGHHATKQTINCASPNAGNYRVINTNAHSTNGLSPSAATTGTKLPTRFRVINNNNHNSNGGGAYAGPSIIKLNSLA
jgi:hypothetical protein